MEKSRKNLHPANRFNQPYDFGKLTQYVPELKPYLIDQPGKTLSIDFNNPKAVFLLNKALLESEYKITNWTILPGSLCPPIPSRLNYIHHLSEILEPSDSIINALDIGTGSNLIYPILGHLEKSWNFVASEVHLPSIRHAQQLLNYNKHLKKHIQLRHQMNRDHVLQGVIQPGEYFHLVLCNPPFFKSAQEHRQSIERKNKGLHQQTKSHDSNFGGLNNELWYPGGEKNFVMQMIYDSFKLRNQIGICTVMISNKDHIRPLMAILEYHHIPVQIIPMSQGNKISRVLCWHLSPTGQRPKH